ncbi:TrbL/VirB6 plasmid conjugal transfer protein [Cupriavidus necator]|uniref:TrbL/VirB6 plasmid conjugal transfer protein n=1 Tax=Cupriavidus necator TaxID=106590 RepID=A0A1K0JQF8_CUPNE|nr:TrbL/VirB6 plasmid conjugal transfer protein [Cupriavidus necator]
MTRSSITGIMLCAVLAVVALFTEPAMAQPSVETSGNTTVLMPAPGSIGEALSSTVREILALRDGLLDGGIALSQRTASEAGKFAWALAVLTLVIGGIRFMAHRNPVGAWVEFIETLTSLGIFVAIYLSYSSFGSGIFKWFDELARAISGGNYDTGAILAYTAAQFMDSFFVAFKAAKWYDKLDVVFSSLGLLVAFAFTALASLIYAYFVIVGQLQAAVGLAIGLIAVSLGFSEFTRKYFWAWFDFMVTASMYVVTAAILANLVATATAETIRHVAAVGTSTAAAGWKAASLSIVIVLISLEIPKLAGSLFGTGGGISGGAAGIAKGAWNLGAKLTK